MGTVRGKLKVLLGAAPGVGKTYAMLKEGHRLVAEGRDVVVAVLETHGRKATMRAAEGLEVVPRKLSTYRGVRLDEMDLFGVIARKPQVALVDELAHTNAPGSTHGKRWQDVEDLLDAGIDVITTINVQHIESLNDVVRDITGSTQRETVPDKILRAAERIELIDLPPQNLRERLAAGEIYSADRVDAALSNYFRVGNLTALRELALLWLANNVDDVLKEYRAEHHINAKWETRERVVVALSGGPEGERLLRRGARVARVGGDLVAVHVTAEDGLRRSDPTLLAQQRELVEKLGGSYHQIVGEDIAAALIDFARANNATQVVIGVSRRSQLARLFGRSSSVNGVIEKSGDIDVHVVSHSYAAKSFRLPRFRRTMPTMRRAIGFVFSAAVVPLLGWILYALSSPENVARDALVFQLIVVCAALLGGLGPALLAALMSGLALDFLYMQPIGTFHMPRATDVMTVLIYIVVGVIVALVVDCSEERSRQARRSAAESEMLSSVAGAMMRSPDPLQAIVDRTREAFGFDCVRLVRNGQILAESGSLLGDGGESDCDIISVGDYAGADERGSGTDGAKHEPGDLHLELYGQDVNASDQRLLMTIVSQIQTALDQADLERKASEVEPLAAAEKIRTALLNAVSHDLRRPLAAATAAISGLERMGASVSDEDRRELLGVADTSLNRLTDLVTDLLDVSRLREGALPLSLVAADVADAVVQALDEQQIGPSGVDLDLSPDLPLVIADPPLLRRAVSNVLLNARRFNPEDQRVRISASVFRSTVEIRIADYGPGVPDGRKEDMFVPFHRLGDMDNTTGLGLGMALSKGFIESMGGTITAEDTPGGGLTMVITLQAADGRYWIGQPIDEEDLRRPAALGVDMFAVSGAVSDVILPLDGSGPSSERGLERFLDARGLIVGGSVPDGEPSNDTARIDTEPQKERP